MLDCGADACLIGEALLAAGNPGENLRALLDDCRKNEGAAPSSG